VTSSTPATPASDPPVARPLSAVGDPASHARLWIFAIGVLVLDLWTKAWIFHTLGPTEVRTLIPRFIEMHRSLNDGAVFGSLTGMVWLFVAASVLALGFVVAMFAGSSPKHRSLHIALGLILAGAMGNLYDRAFMVADIVEFNTGEPRLIAKIVDDSHPDVLRIGSWPEGENPRTYRRSDIAELRQQGVVRDFIRFVPAFPGWAPWVGGKDMWPWIFNIADSGLVIGVGLLLLNFWFERREARAG
jgi:signal peptidase II